MMNCEARQSSEITTVAFTGECTLDRARELSETLLNALRASGQVGIDLKEVTAADVSFLQLICSAHRTAIESMKRLTFSCRPSEAFIETARGGGFCRTIGCHGDKNRECMWMEVTR